MSGRCPDTLASKAIWESAERHWNDVLSRVAERHGQGGEWKPLYERAFIFADGSSYDFPDDYAGLALVDAWSERLDRGIRIFARSGVQTAPWVLAWTQEERQLPEILPRWTLVIQCCSAENSAVVSELLDCWMEPTVTLGEMEAAIERIAPSSRPKM